MTPRTTRYLALAALGLAAILGWASPNTPPPAASVHSPGPAAPPAGAKEQEAPEGKADNKQVVVVDAVHDIDKIHVTGEHPRDIRILGITPPPCRHDEALAWATTTLLGKKLVLRTGGAISDEDENGRTLARVAFVDSGESYAPLAAGQGWAQSNFGNLTARSALDIATIKEREINARIHQRGSWSCS